MKSAIRIVSVIGEILTSATLAYGRIPSVLGASRGFGFRLVLSEASQTIELSAAQQRALRPGDVVGMPCPRT